MKYRVFVTRRLPEPALDKLRTVADVEVWPEQLPPTKEEIINHTKDKDGLLSLLTDQIDAEVMDAAPNLKVIANYAVGYDNIDVKAASERGIKVGNTPGVLTETTADLAFALLLSSARRIVEADKYTREGKWKSWEPMLFLGQDIHHATIGIVGLGRIGAEVARRAAGFSMRILYYDFVRRPDVEESLGAQFAELETLLRESDFITLHVPLTPETKQMIGKREFEMMKPNAVFINTARGGVVDQQALYEALKNKTITAAGLDVFEIEPIPADDPLLQLENVTVVPHIASASVATRTKMAFMAVENLIAGLEGKPMPNEVKE